MPCASVSAKRTFTSVEKPKSTAELSTIGAVDVSALVRLIQANQPCVVLTGAGVSTESGIPDFRSATGIWAEFDPAEYASLPAFRADPAKVWRFYKPRIETLTAGGCVAILNQGPTPYDRRADLKLEEKAGKVLGAVADALV